MVKSSSTNRANYDVIKVKIKTRIIIKKKKKMTTFIEKKSFSYLEIKGIFAVVPHGHHQI